MFDVMTDLDPAQADAVEHGENPLVIVAGAGTGKTQTLTCRVARLLERGVAPEQILLLTFTRRAAAEMTTRAAALCGDSSAARRMWRGTFHAVAHRLVTEYARSLDLPQVILLDPADVVELVDTMREDFGLTGTTVRLPSAQTMADICSRAVNTGRSAREIITLDFPQYQHAADPILSLLGHFMTRKRELGLLDFDDLLLSMRALLADPAIGQRIRARWSHVLVDEYQDLNQIQVDIVHLLRPDGRGLTVVGDDAQAVYGFRGAHSAHLLEATTAFPDATVVRLETNFRSLQPILDLANLVRPQSDDRHTVTLQAARDSAGAARPVLRNCYDAADQAQVVAEAVLAAREEGLALSDQAVLMRASAHSRELEIELGIRHIPYVKYGGLRYTETAHVKDLIASLRVATQPTEELSWYRLLKLHRHIGKSHARTLAALLVEPDAGAADAVAAAPPKARTALSATLSTLAEATAAGPGQARIELCLAALRPLLKVSYVDAALRQDDLDRLGRAAAASSDLELFLAELILDPAGATTDYAKPPQVDDDYLVLSTVHSAKGLEWKNVHVIHAADGSFPSDMSLNDPDGLAEEARLFYVALTRARNELTLYHPQRMHRDSYSDRHVFTQLTRFLTDEAQAVLDQRHPGGGRPSGAAAAPAGRATGGGSVSVPTMSELFA